ncbi:hypothetical protein KFL_002820170 [Klebsormidium nitens]|uniref:Uncharacterized protein n=1 Tax=Klebsormidium nitens TaxID=105231 RepID=A0A1Y1IB24_KLENI|nr:hypothetical protein KFL_002820170 [Klebsormidium nitens]|eukprot:GAQ86321.1 hypothetical protein KFL_002820170 [Klebsormidium nitens]
MASSSGGTPKAVSRPRSSRALSSQAAGFSGRSDSRASAASSTGSKKATKKPGADSIMNRDPNAVSRGIKNLDQLMAHLQEKNRLAKEQIAADTEEIARLDKELAHVEPKLEALERGLTVKRAEKDALLADIKKQTEEFNQVLEQSSALAKRANRLNAKMYTKAASDTLEATRGFNMRASVKELQSRKGSGSQPGRTDRRESVPSPGGAVTPGDGKAKQSLLASRGVAPSLVSRS